MSKSCGVFGVWPSLLTRTISRQYFVNLSKEINDAHKLSFTAFGAKACGGPQGYLPYSNQIDTNAFLKKVEVYSQSEKEYNLKWGVISDCAIVNPPKSIECQNGYPILKY